MGSDSSIREEIAIFWFRRDLRLSDNTGLWHALSSGYRVLPVFIYDRAILSRLEKDDPRMHFLYSSLQEMDIVLKRYGSSLATIYSSPLEAFKTISGKYSIKALFFNRDYEPYALERDTIISGFCHSRGIPVFSFRDHVIFEKDDVLKNDGKPYTVYTPYSAKWLALFRPEMIRSYPSEELIMNCIKFEDNSVIHPEQFGFHSPEFIVKDPVLDQDHIALYDRSRDIPARDGTSFLGPHLRFGTISIREVLRKTAGISQTFVKELIWREFFMQILYHFPRVTENSFRREYDSIEWISNEEHFDRWCKGTTGFPLVDAGMRELSATGYMHNRVRMVAANFLTRLLLTDWRLGEAWFASRLLDYELSSNNGNWQWAAGTGCDAAPYFRIFNPEMQVKKFDPDQEYIRKWVPEYGTGDYATPVVDYLMARERAVQRYKSGITR